ncbi:hypothetical protein [Nonomuraea sp. NPDC049400]|uniref:hypothetical protein n=1 Tax=Nonomuraea sp. NPDC049400 TaxID=3364352 RepID=UPI0037880667
MGATRRAQPGDQGQKQAFGGGDPPPHWRSAAERPARWLRGYAGALADVWNTTEPLWKRGRPLLDREVERVSVAAVRGDPELLLGALSDRIAYGERGLLISDLESGTFELGDRKIVLVPMLAGKDALITSLDSPEAVWIAYPVPGADSLWRKPAAPAVDELSALVGPVRADLLCALDQPMTMSMPATGMKIAPSGLTYHCDRLRAGAPEADRRLDQPGRRDPQGERLPGREDERERHLNDHPARVRRQSPRDQHLGLERGQGLGGRHPAAGRSRSR